MTWSGPKISVVTRSTFFTISEKGTKMAVGSMEP